MNTPLKNVPAGILVLSLFVASCTSPKPQVPPAMPKSYPLITVDPQKAVLNLDYPATLEGEQTVEIRPRVEGIIEAIFVDEGQVVKRGQALFRLDQAKYLQTIRSLEASVKVAEAQVNAAKMEVNKVKPLVEKEIVSKYSLESAEYTLQSRDAALAQAKALLANAKTDLSYTIISSPTNGVIGTIPFKIGALVGSSMPQPLTTVANTSDVYAYFSLNEKQLSDFKIGSAPAVQLLLPDGSVYSGQGKIQTMSGLIDPATGSVRMRASFPNPQGLLRSGGSGTIRIPVTIDTALLVPQKAAYEIQGKHFVYVLHEPDSVVRSVEIAIDPVGYNQAFVVRSGLKKGDKIVIEGAATLMDSTKIIPKVVNADSVLNSKPQL